MRGRAQRTARLQRAQIADELPCAVFPGALKRKTPANLEGRIESREGKLAAAAIGRHCPDRSLGPDMNGVRRYRLDPGGNLALVRQGYPQARIGRNAEGGNPS